MIKKIFLILVMVLITTNAVEAKDVAQVELNVSKSEVEIADTFQVSVSVKNANIRGLNIDIPGLDSFQKTSNSQSTMVQIINGTTNTITETVLTFKALNIGSYNIGPIELKIGSSSIKSNIEHIKVNEKKEKKSFFKNSVSNEAEKNDLSHSDQSQTKKNDSKNSNIKDIVVNILAVALLCGLLFAFYKQKQYKKNEVMKDTEEEREVKEMDNKQELPDKDDPEFFMKMKKIIIAYIQNKHKLKIAAFTTQEIIKKLELKKIYNREELKKALNLCNRGSFSFDEAGKDELINIVKSLK